MRRCVIGKRTKRRALAATALIEQDDAIEIGVEESAMRGTRLAARAPMDKNYREAMGISAFLEIDSMTASDIEKVAVKRFKRGIKRFAGGLAIVYNHAGINLDAIRSSAA